MAVSKDLERSRELADGGNYKKAVHTLWRVEANARTDAAEAEGLRELATALREMTSGRTREECELLIGYAEASLRNIDRRPQEVVAVEPPSSLPIILWPPASCAVGAVSGALIGAAIGPDDPESFMAFSRGDYMVLGALLFGVVGLAVGMAVVIGRLIWVVVARLRH